MERIRLVVVDDHPMVLMGMKLTLKVPQASHIELCGCYDSGSELLLHVDDLHADLILIDLIMPDINGDEMIDRLLEKNATYKIGIYSSCENENMIISAFAKGALGYLSKVSDNTEFIAFINTLYKGDRYVRGKIATILLGNNRQNFASKEDIRLTVREKEVATMILDGITSREIASKLFISERTVEFHRRNIYAKFKESNVIGLVNSWAKNSITIV